MRPAEFTGALRASRDAVTALPSAVESVALAEATRGVPRGVGVRVTRTNAGVVVVFSGRGARRAARSAAPRLRRAGVAAVLERVRGLR